MAARKKVVENPPFSGPNEERHFAHPDGRTYALQVIDCRVFESWTNKDHGGGSNQSTRDSDGDAQAFAWAKVKGLLKKGFVEGPVKTGRRMHDPNVDVVEVLLRNLTHSGTPVDDFQPLAGRPNVYLATSPFGPTWLFTSDDRRLGIMLRCVRDERSVSDTEHAAMADALVELLVTTRDAIFADATTPLRKIPLVSPIGRFSHLIVLSPVTTNLLVKWQHTISRSVYSVFPAFDCEFTGDESVTVAEGRTQGHASLSSSKWGRAPHPVLDLAYPEKASDTPKFLVYDPKEMEKRLGGSLAKLKGEEVLARNYAGVVRRFQKNQTPPDVEELRRHFGFQD